MATERIRFLIILAYVSWQITAGVKIETLRYCCGLGTNYAKSGLKCTSFQKPIAGIQKEDEAHCLNSVDVCCKKQYRETQCTDGQHDAKSGQGCVSSGNSAGGDFRKDCCEACQLGLEAGLSGQSCDSVEIGLGPPYDKSFSGCCEEKRSTTIYSSTFGTKSTITSTSTSTTTSTTTTTATPLTTIDLTTSEDTNITLPPPPPLEGLCDIEGLCAHICLPTRDSYKCECYEGYTLMADGISCKPNRRSPPHSKRCEINNPCDQECIDTGVSIQCACFDGYVLDKDKRSCNDIDECSTGTHECSPEQICINLDGDYECQYSGETKVPLTDFNYDGSCPKGYKFDAERLVCDDIDECEIGIVCERPSTCVNTIGSFICEKVLKCPPGFYFKDATQNCQDIDECVAGQDDCNRESQICLNTKGNFTCIDKASKKSCPPGFKKNIYTQQCEDINECEESAEICNADEECVNEPGGHNCIKKESTNTKAISLTTYKLPPQTSTYVKPTTVVQSTSKSVLTAQSSYEPQRVTPATSFQSSKQPNKELTQSETQHSSQSQPTRQTQATYTPTRPPYHYQPQETQIPTQNPNQLSSWDPQPEQTKFQSPQQPRIPYTPTHQQPYHQSQKPTYYQPPYYPLRNVTPTLNQPASCTRGYRFSEQYNRCLDIDECLEENEICDSNQDCYNTIGSFICNCKIGFTKDYQTGACIDINECQVGQHDCSEGQRCDNTIGSFLCSRVTGCGTGYTLNSASGLCEDDDECLLGLHNCKDLGPKYQCRNTLGSYRCERIKCTGDCFVRKVYSTSITKFVPPKTEPNNYPIISGQLKKCLPGYIMNANGVCEDINECESNPCRRGEKCLNLNGRYQCISQVQCKSGYELNEAGNGCVDVNECTRGIHKCKSSQVCKNGIGYYICQCPPGHKLNAHSECEDIDECEYYRGRICSINSDCLNTIGSYTCQCKEGFRENGEMCDDVDECAETRGLCHQTCVNLWGSYRCSCERGFTLNNDNRTCTDIDECEKFKERKLCIGTCINTPGSYSCKCPDGYRLGADGRTCQDIDECQINICPRLDDICFNTRGSYKCQTITCPANYIRDPEHKSRCKRASNVCDIRDLQCLRMPQQYSYHFITFVSNLPVPQGPVSFFQMKGPSWLEVSTDFTMKFTNIRCPASVQKANEHYFRLTRGPNKAIISLVRSIQGPQEIEIQLEMTLYHKSVFNGIIVAKIYIVVSDYNF